MQEMEASCLYLELTINISEISDTTVSSSNCINDGNVKMGHTVYEQPGTEYKCYV